MATTPTQIRNDPTIKEHANNQFPELPNYNKSVIDAMNEAKSISRDSNTPSYTNMTDLKAALEDDD